jgi:23S rRNA (guanine2445-N2)-methyltransferase / 23S rRNA (guanine2069-N7)-methyltransferase
MGGATFDVQRDHADLVRLVARRFLADDGVLLFSSNRRDFALDGAALSGAGLRIADLSRSTLPPDFTRGGRSHHVFRVTRVREGVGREGLGAPG